ncbi:hypothetical protein PTSG_07466 [Salpingoeca rosetta]|uniref:Uncharacterized protein n=1 Tax=Salpingoeca rosetta (strain ATCC 50818 / BSB-021) TaxID=946362 RepID=F2UIT3_SALR5|nr:uncharacterized protein PTSG_07466 [Salpingoeca rosetta]EGD77132.1 hypothetical protein PTSG_07466 [Salpingoeca rosetta]|eukprot:XP_004990971.1 hypothetical protein PTSG_07466 [Salpingoeca rosetta]
MDEVHSLREEHRWHTNQVVVGDLCLPCVASCIQRGLNLDHCLGALLAVLKDHVVLASTVLNHTPDVLDALLRALVHAAAVDTGANNNNNNNNNGDPAHPQSPQACLRCFLEKPLNTPHTTAALAMLLCSQVHAMRGGSSKKMVALLELLVDTLVDAGPDACQHLKQHGDALLETMAPLVATLPSRLPVLVVLTLHKQGVLHLPSLSPIHRVRLTEGVCHALPERTRQPHDSGPYAAVLDLITLRGTQLPLELLQTRRCADALRSLLHSADNDVAEVTVRLMHNACTSGPHARAACAYFQTAQLQEDVWAVARRASTATATTAAATADTTTSKEADSATTCEASNAAATPNLLGAALTCALALTYNSSPARFLAALTTATQLANSRMTRRDDESTAADAAGARALLTTLDAAIPTVLQHTQFFVSTEMQHAFFQLVGAALEIAGRADTGAGAAVAAAGVMGHGHTHRQHVNTTGRGGGGGLQREMEQARHVELAHASRYPSNHKRASNNHNSDGSDDSLLATRLGMGSAFATKLVRAGFIELCLMTARLLPDHRQRSAPQIGVLLNVLSLAMAQDDSSSGGQRNGDSRAVRRGGGGGRGPDTGVHVRTIAHALDPASIATVLRRGLSAVLTDKQAIPRTVSSAMGTVGQRHNGHRHHHQQSQQQHTASVVLLPGPTGVAVLMLYLQLLLSPTRMTSPFAPQQQREYAAALDQFLRTHAQRKWPLTPLRHIAHIVARLALYSSGTQGLAQTLVLRADELQSSSDQHHCRGGGGSGVNRQDDEMTLKMVLWVLCHPDLTAMQKKEALAAFQPTIHAHLDHPDVKALATAAWFSSLFLSIVQSARVDLVELVLLICGQHKSVMELPANPAHIFDALHARANQSPVDRGAKETAMVLYTCQRALTDALNQLGDRDAVLACHPLLVRILSTSDAGATNQDALSSYCLVVQRWACLAAYLDREQARHRLPPIIADVADRMWAIRRIAPTPAADAAIAALVALDSIQHTRALATLERLLCEEEELWTLQTTEALALQNLLLQQYHFRQQQQQCSDGESDNSADRQVCASTAHATPGSDARMRQRLPALAMRTLNRLAGMTASPVDVGATIAVTSACVSSSSQHIFSNSPWIDTILADMAEASTPKLTCLLVLAQQLLDQRPSVVAPYLLQAASACSSVLEMVDAHQPVRTILAPILDDVISRVRNGGCGGLERWDWPIKYELPQGTEQSTALDPRRPHKLPNANILPLAAILPCTLTAV